MNLTRSLFSLAATVALAVLSSAAAWAQDYTVSSVTGQFVTPPSTGTTDVLPNISNKDDGIYTITSLPFAIPYFGVNVTSISVCTNGYCFMNASGAHATAYSPTSYPYPQTTTGSSGRDGIVAAAWQDLDGRGTGAKILTWTDGTAPNRRFIISYQNWMKYSLTGFCQFQFQFYESGRIQMAYSGSWTGSGGGAWNYATGAGIDAITPDTRWVTPNGSSTYNITSQPANDWRFEPKLTNFTGTVLMDRYVVDATGIGNSIVPNQPASGLRVELRNSSNAVAATGTTDASGTFAVKGVALVSSQIGSLVITGQNLITAVRQVTGGTSSGVTLATNVSFAADRDVGTLTINESNDPGGTGRVPLNIAGTVQQVYDWASQRTSATIPFLEILYDPASSAPTSYSAPGAFAASMRVAGGTANPDGWDRAIIRKTYARHVLGAIAGHPSGAYDPVLDKVTSEQNAFGEAFGYYLHCAVSGETGAFPDGISKTSATVTQLEEIVPLVSPRGPDVSAFVAMALFDLTDLANEPWDTIDGTGSAIDRPFRAVDSLTSAPTAATFFDAWIALGYGGGPLSTNFIRHGLLSDDNDEPNDTSSSPKVLTQFGLIRPDRVLNRSNEDWFEFNMPQPTNRLLSQIAYDRFTYNTTIGLEIRDASNNLIATGSAQGATGPVLATTGALPAGVYRLRVTHTGGVRLPNYTLQAFSELAFSAAAFQPWTVGRPYNVPVNVKGGVPPYTLVIEAPFVHPPGLILDGANARVRGTPTAKGLYNFVLSARDKASPSNVASGPQSFLVNDELKFQFGEFLAIPFDKDLDMPAAYTGGTAPYTMTIAEGGALPPGTSVADGELKLTGRANIPGSYRFEVTGTDFAGSSATAPLTGVVCVPFGTTTLALGQSACGYYFDGVAGSTVKISVKTAPGSPKRPLRVAVLDQNGTTVLEAKLRGGKGVANVSGLELPSTGRFYCVVASDTGEATRITATGKIVPNKGDAGINPDINFVAGDQYRVKLGALAGAKLTFTATPDRGSGLQLKPIYLLDPDNNIVLLSESDFTEKGGSFTVNKVLGASGTWTMIVGAKPGPQGQFRYAYKVQEPKGAVYTAD